MTWVFVLTVLGIAAGGFMAACTTVEANLRPTVPLSFADYQRATYEQLQARRNFQHPDKAAELAWNGPQEWRPSRRGGGRLDRGILLVHGLGDSPWSFHDLGERLAAQGFLVRTVLLPGHGTRPEELLDVTVGQWRRVVQEQTMLLQQEVGKVYLGGFSTGANLVVEYAYTHSEIAGLVLFSPGFKGASLDWLAPMIAPIWPWLLGSPGSSPMQNAVRYLTVPTNGLAQFHHSSAAVRQWLSQRPYDRPVFMAVAQHDSVLDTGYLLNIFQRRFTHPDSRLIWYGATPTGLTDMQRVLIRNDRLPEQHIDQFSHMGLLFSPQNPLYGKHGSLRICSNGQDTLIERACEKGAPVWYSDWGYREDGKIHARLTFNPYFDWQTFVMAAVFENHQADRHFDNGATR